MHMDRNNTVILAMIRGWQPPPSIDEMCRATGLRSTNTITIRLLWMEKEGYIIKNSGRRNVVATEKGEEFFPEFIVLPPKDGKCKHRPIDI